jgi:hypothetical protein
MVPNTRAFSSSCCERSLRVPATGVHLRRLTRLGIAKRILFQPWRRRVHWITTVVVLAESDAAGSRHFGASTAAPGAPHPPPLPYHQVAYLSTLQHPGRHRHPSRPSSR